MLTIQDWLDAGYRRCESNAIQDADFLLQKRIDDKEGMKYYITVEVYEWKNRPYFWNHTSCPDVSFQPDIQFTRDNGMSVNVQWLMDDDSTIKEVEQEIEKMWVFLGESYLDKWKG